MEDGFDIEMGSMYSFGGYCVKSYTYASSYLNKLDRNRESHI